MKRGPKPHVTREQYLARHRKGETRRNAIRKYGLTREAFDALYDFLEKGPCDICGTQDNRGRKFNIDHEHNEKRFRGILCHACNLLLGHAKDDVKILERAISYLRRNGDG